VPEYFTTPREFRKWLATNHQDVQELWVGFYKKTSGKRSITWPESIDEALCFGWIDGVRKTIDETSYAIRFSQRRTRSKWSEVNVKKAQSLLANGRMQPAGLVCYESRRENRGGGHLYAERPEELPDPYQRMLKKHKDAWKYFQAQPAHYRKAITWWVVSAQKDETRLRRLEKLVEYSERHECLPEMAAKKPKGH